MHVESAGISIVAIDGACTGADFERALEADIRVAADGATFSADGARDLAACAHRLTRLLGEARAKEIVLGPRRFDAATALRLGIVTRVVTDKVMAQVELTAGPFRVVSLMSTEAVRELGLEPGVLAVASVKSTNVVVEVPQQPA